MHDPRLAATRRAARAAVVIPALFALCTQVLHSATTATFAAFASFSMLLLTDFTGPMKARLRAQVSLTIVWMLLVTIATLVAPRMWLAVLTTLVVAFAVLFSGVVSSVLAGSTTSMLLGFMLPVGTPGTLSQLPDRLSGVGLAGLSALVAIAFLWPLPVSDPLCRPAARVCSIAASALRANPTEGGTQIQLPRPTPREVASSATAGAVGDLRKAFQFTLYRPTNLSATSRSLVRLVDELTWLGSILSDPPVQIDGKLPSDPAALSVRLAAADVLDCAADLLANLQTDVTPLRDRVNALHEVLESMARTSAARLSTDAPSDESPEGTQRFIERLDFSFRAQEIGLVVLRIATNLDAAAVAWQRSWHDRLLGREPGILTAPVASAIDRAGAHMRWGSVWLHNSLRGSVGLGLAVLLVNLTSVQHSFWVLLGAVSVLRSNALSTGQNAVRAVLGTVAGSIVGAVLLQFIGHQEPVLWLLLPVAVLIAGIAPSAISFAAGQAAFTVTLVILFNIGQNPDWHIVLIRVQDITLGCLVSFLVAVFFWPRGATAAVDQALARAYAASSRYLVDAVTYGLSHCSAGDNATLMAEEPVQKKRDAAAAARRLDDAFRTYLAERGAKPIPLAEMTTLVVGVVALRLTGDSILSLWRNCPRSRTDRGQVDAHRAILLLTTQVAHWYEVFGAGLNGKAQTPPPLPLDSTRAARLAASVRADFVDSTGRATDTAVRVIWTEDYVDFVRRLQRDIAGAARGGPVKGSREHEER